MRPSQKQNRARGRGNRKPNGNVVNRVFESAGPEGKVRGTPQQIIDKYLALARDSQTSGDRVMGENFLQHAEHYQRILLDAQGVRDDRRDPRGQDQDGQQDGQDDSRDGDGRDDSDDSEDQAARQNESRRDDSRRDDNRRDDNRRDDRPAAQDGGQQGGQSGGQNAEDTAQNDGARRGNRRGGNRRRETEVSGLTTIDSSPDEGESLLVEADELSASQPPRRRRAPRRDRAQESDQGTDRTGAGSQND